MPPSGHGNVTPCVTFVTVYSRDGQNRKGEDVGVVSSSGETYLRTDNNSTRADNLGALPEYA